MCHLILMMPLLALPMFWFLPLDVAAPVYAVVVGVSIWLYWYVMQSMHRPVETGAEEIRHATGKVIEVGSRLVQVRVHSEIWSAESADKLRRNDLVEVIGIDGLRLKVRRAQQAASATRGRRAQHA